MLNQFHNLDDIRASLPDTISYNGELIPCDSTKEFSDVFGIEGYRPIVFVATYDAQDMSIDQTVIHQDSITGATKTYKIKGIEPDGEGLTRLIMETQ